MMRAMLFGFILCFASAGESREKGGGWHETDSPHFAVIHEMTWLPAGFIMNLERMHGRLRMDLGWLSPWMDKERIKLYLYKTTRSYLAGEFQPPAWSNGLAIFASRSVAVPDQADHKVLLRVISHESTHLLFDGYWHEASKAPPPAWINEGLAMMEENDTPAQPERSPWFQSMVLAKPDSFLPMQRFFALSPTKDLDNKAAIGDWYIQAYSMVYFLYHEYQSLQFKNLCIHLREGRSLERCLWLAYRYNSLDSLEKDWRRWLGRADMRARVRRALADAPHEEYSSEGRKDPSAPLQFTPMKGFKSLRE